MIKLSYDLATGAVKLSQTTVIKFGSAVPVQVVFSGTPGVIGGIELALGTDAATPEILAFTDVFASDNDTTWSALLDGNDTRLAAFMNGKGATSVNAELVTIIDGQRLIAPNVSITVQPRINNGAETTVGGPNYLTDTEVNALLAAKANLTVVGKYRIKGDGSFQLWNATQNKFHSLTLSGAAGAEVLSIGAGEG